MNGNILEPLKTRHFSFALFLQTVYAIEKLLTGFNVQPYYFNVQPKIGMNQAHFESN